jgi:hypothetical protein
MKVGISYAVELSEIPDELQKLVKRSSGISEKLELLTEQVKSGDFGCIYANIKNMRYNLQRTDTRLEDCSILTGYLTVLKNGCRRSRSRGSEEAKEIGLGVRQSRPWPNKTAR